MSESVLWDNWRRHTQERPDDEAIVVWAATDAPYRWTWRRLVEAAIHKAARLQEAGIRRHDVCAIILRHQPEFFPLYMAISALGALPTVLAYPNARLHPEKFRHGLEGMAKKSGLDWILTEEELAQQVAPLTCGRDSTVRGTLLPSAWTGAGDNDLTGASGDLERTLSRLGVETDPDKPCLLQHSSGTTGLQKGVVLSHRAVIEHLRRYGTAIGARPDDRIASWLPLYHDMGLIAAFHLPLALGIPLVQIDPFEWVCAPGLLLQAVSQEEATLTWLPNFAFNFMAERLSDEELDAVRLDSLRLVVNCSEPVRADSHRRLIARLEPSGLSPECLGASYAMAEATFAVTQTEPGKAARTLRVDRDALERGEVRPADKLPAERSRECVSSGAPIQGCEVRIVDEQREPAPPNQIGEIKIRSASLFSGYRNDPESSERVLSDGWYHTGDLGFVHDGECYVVGRQGDLIIVAGRNIHPEDIEYEVNGVEGVIPGRVVAFGRTDDVSGTEKIWVIAESSDTGADAVARLQTAIKVAVLAIDVTVDTVSVVPPRWLVKSSAGKPARKANKDRILAAGRPPLP